MESTPIGGRYFRIASPEWSNPLDPLFAAQPPGQRWNPPGLPCLYLNHDVATARANVNRQFAGLPYSPESLHPATAPQLVEIEVPNGQGADAHSEGGLAALGLLPTYPHDASGNLIPHEVCQPIGQSAFDAELDGVDCRSAAPGGTRELAWFPRDSQPTQISLRHFDQWW
ncbi:MAG: RES family NAD+ phosphorylase [bacterium]|nr:RES family NAD+ phosphorylase [bacterium]